MSVFIWEGSSGAQTAPSGSAQPSTTSVSDYGTTFIFSPTLICSKCLQTELGFESEGNGRYAPAAITFAPFQTTTDISVLANLGTSKTRGKDEVIQFGNRVDFVVRQEVFAKGGLLLVAAPRGALYTRGVDGGRAGVTAAGEFNRGKNLAAVNFTWTGAIGASAANPKSEYLGLFDYFRMLDKRRTRAFLGFAHGVSAGKQAVGIEEGLAIPLRRTQVEFETAQLNLNVKPVWQFQTRVVVNWGKIFSRKSGSR